MNLSLIPAQRLIPSQVIELVFALRCCLLLTRPLSCHFQSSLQQSTCLYVNCLSSLNWTEEKNEFFKIIPVFFKASAFLLTLFKRKNRLLIGHLMIWFNTCTRQIYLLMILETVKSNSVVAFSRFSCEDCKLAAPPVFSRGVGPRFRVHRFKSARPAKNA